MSAPSTARRTGAAAIRHQSAGATRPASRLTVPHPAPAFPRILRTTVTDWVRALQAEGADRRAIALRSIGIETAFGHGAGERDRDRDRDRGTVPPAGTVA